MRPQVLQLGHASRLTCYPGAARTLAFLRGRFWWLSIKEDVRTFVAACSSCAKNKTSIKAPADLLHPLPVPHRPWSHIALDFVTGLPACNGNTCILTIVDRFRKSVHFVSLLKLPTAKMTAKLLIDRVFRLHGLPTDVVSDRGFQFSSLPWIEYEIMLLSWVCHLSDVVLAINHLFSQLLRRQS